MVPSFKYDGRKSVGRVFSDLAALFDQVSAHMGKPLVFPTVDSWGEDNIKSPVSILGARNTESAVGVLIHNSKVYDAIVHLYGSPQQTVTEVTIEALGDTPARKTTERRIFCGAVEFSCMRTVGINKDDQS